MDPAFHAGEVALQESVGAHEHLAEVGPRVIRDWMPQQHRDFFAQLPFMVIGTVDAHGQPWASALAGPPGFVASPRQDQLVVASRVHEGDPAAQGLKVGARIGLLGIEPHTRRRNRANGRVDAIAPAGFSVHVEQSFGNCPKYIQARRARFVGGVVEEGVVERSDRLDPKAVRAIRSADTFFIATAHPRSQDGSDVTFGVDVSHRGGKPGFVHVDEDAQRLTVPDFLGNSFFNTLGNLALEPRCGLAFIDYDTGAMLQLACRGRIESDPGRVARFAGAQRLLVFEVDAVVRRATALPLSWSAAELSPHLQGTGSWTEATAGS